MSKGNRIIIVSASLKICSGRYNNDAVIVVQTFVVNVWEEGLWVNRILVPTDATIVYLTAPRRPFIVYAFMASILLTVFVSSVLILGSVPAILAAATLLWYPLRELALLLPTHNYIYFTVEHVNVVSPYRHRVFSWADAVSATLGSERGMFRKRKSLTVLILVNEEGKRFRVNFGNYYGNPPDHWGAKLVDIFVAYNIAFPENVGSVLTRLGGPRYPTNR